TGHRPRSPSPPGRHASCGRIPPIFPFVGSPESSVCPSRRSPQSTGDSANEDKESGGACRRHRGPRNQFRGSREAPKPGERPGINRILAVRLALFLFSPIMPARRSSGYHRSYSSRSPYGYRARSRSHTSLYSNRGGTTRRSATAKAEFKREPGLIVEIGIGLMDQKKYEDAIPVLKRCVAVNPDAAECWAFLGDASWALDRRSDARDFWTKTIEI